MLSHSPRRGVGASIWMPLKPPRRPHPALIIAALGVLLLCLRRSGRSGGSGGSGGASGLDSVGVSFGGVGGGRVGGVGGALSSELSPEQTLALYSVEASPSHPVEKNSSADVWENTDGKTQSDGGRHIWEKRLLQIPSICRSWPHTRPH